MHYHLEIVMPPTDDVESAVAQIMAPFDENGTDDDDHTTKHAFWDFYCIGGRWSGAKVLAMCGKERLDAFRAALKEHKITVSGLVFGKETLQPTEQIPAVDALWCEYFPESPIKVCPIFDNYKGDFGDVCRLADVPVPLSCSHAIIAAPAWKSTKPEAKYMVRDSEYNGVSWIKTTWDQTLGSAIAVHAESLSRAEPAYAEQQIPGPDWLVVTVDYHS